MSRWHNRYYDGCAHFCTFTLQDRTRTLDAAAIRCIHEEWRAIGARFHVRILAYVIMPDHVHMFVWSATGESVMRFLQRFLGQTSKRLSPGAGRLWKERPHVLPIYNERALREKIDYIHANPIRRGLVANPED